MASAKAPRWLTQAFQQGVDAFAALETPVHRTTRAAYPGAHPLCWLAAHDPAKRPCSPGHLERFHFIRRQDVEAAMWAQLPTPKIDVFDPASIWTGLDRKTRDELVLIAAWDPRNGGLACEQHHRRYDQHQVSLPRERVIVRYEALPPRVIQFGFDYSEGRLLDRFPSDI